MNLSILVADDHDVSRKCLCRVLQDEGYRVVEASDGKQAIDEISKAKFNLILTNLKMPHADGYEVLRHANKTDPQAPVIVISGFGNEQTKLEAVRQGARDYIFKPVAFDDLLRKIKIACEETKVKNAWGAPEA
jgi:DNA-binding NtrC family response regulator